MSLIFKLIHFHFIIHVIVGTSDIPLISIALRSKSFIFSVVAYELYEPTLTKFLEACTFGLVTNSIYEVLKRPSGIKAEFGIIGVGVLADDFDNTVLS
jgi:hypothetical protein